MQNVTWSSVRDNGFPDWWPDPSLGQTNVRTLIDLCINSRYLPLPRLGGVWFIYIIYANSELKNELIQDKKLCATF